MRMENLRRGILNAVVFQDDITSGGKDLERHMKSLKANLQNLQTSDLELNGKSKLTLSI